MNQGDVTRLSPRERNGKRWSWIVSPFGAFGYFEQKRKAPVRLLQSSHAVEALVAESLVRLQSLPTSAVFFSAHFRDRTRRFRADFA